MLKTSVDPFDRPGDSFWDLYFLQAIFNGEKVFPFVNTKQADPLCDVNKTVG